MPRHGVCRLFCILLTLLPAGAARAQGFEPEDRPVEAVRLEGLAQVPEQLVRNQIRMTVGEPYDARTVREDIVRLTHLGRFAQVRAEVDQADTGGVVLTYVFEEQPLLRQVQIRGNTAIGTADLYGGVLLRPGDAADPFLIERGKQQIVDRYREKGYFAASVAVDELALKERNELVYTVREGPRIRVRGFVFEGNEAIPDKKLKSRLRSKTYFPVFQPGTLSREELDRDVARLRELYDSEGYLNAEVGREILVSPDQKSAVVRFVIDEGPRFNVRKVTIEGAQAFPEAQVRRAMRLHSGDVMSEAKVRDTAEAIQMMYGKLGYLNTRVSVRTLPDPPVADLVIEIDEGQSYKVGRVSITGNELTKQSYILHQVRGMRPGRPFDREGLEQTRRRLNSSSLFSGASVTVLGEEDDEYRDVLIEVEEQQTGSVSFGVGANSDFGIAGAVDLTQRNFDITDTPDSFEELVTGKAFRGGGEFFRIVLSPGDETSRYSVDWRDPFFLESDFSLGIRAFIFQREREDYDEGRVGGSIGLGRRFGDVWRADADVTLERINVDNIEDDAPLDVFEVEGDNLLAGVGVGFRRSTVDSAIAPSQGSRWEVEIEQYGAGIGDFDFTRLTTEFHKFWTVDEDFLGRKTVFSIRTEAGYIIGDAPVFERLYAGGHSTFRGFEFRGVGPRGIQADTLELGDEPVGGDFLFLVGAEYEFPIVQDLIRGVIFTDQGTVDEEISLSKWRVSVGAGARIKLPIFGQAPLAIDFGVPLVKEEGDETRVFSFDVDIPFR